MTGAIDQSSGRRRRRRDDDVARVALWRAGAAAAAAVLLWAVYSLRDVLLIAYVSVLLAAGLGPAVRWLERVTRTQFGLNIPRSGAVLLVYAVGVGVAALVAWVAVPLLVEQATELSTRMPSAWTHLQRWLVSKRWLTSPLSVGDVVAQGPGTTDIIQSALATVASVLGGVFGVVTIIVLSIYFLLDAESLLGTLVDLAGPERRPRIRRMLYDISQRASAWLSGQLVLAVVIGASTTIVLGLLGVPYFVVLGIVAGAGEIVPYAGPAVAAVPALLLAAGQSWQLFAIVAAFYFVQQQLENHLLLPRLMAQQVGVRPVVVLLAVLAGGSVSGLTGVLLAVPTAAILEILLRQLVAEARR